MDPDLSIRIRSGWVNDPARGVSRRRGSSAAAGPSVGRWPRARRARAGRGQSWGPAWPRWHARMGVGPISAGVYITAVSRWIGEITRMRAISTALGRSRVGLDWAAPRALSRPACDRCGVAPPGSFWAAVGQQALEASGVWRLDATTDTCDGSPTGASVGSVPRLEPRTHERTDRGFVRARRAAFVRDRRHPSQLRPRAAMRAAGLWRALGGPHHRQVEQERSILRNWEKLDRRTPLTDSAYPEGCGRKWSLRLVREMWWCAFGGGWLTLMGLSSPSF